MGESLNDRAKKFLPVDCDKATALPVLILMWWGLAAAWEKMGLAEKYRDDLQQIVLNLMDADQKTANEYLLNLPSTQGRSDLLSALNAAKTTEQAASGLLGILQDRLVSASSTSRRHTPREYKHLLLLSLARQS